jgi:hypothetical protein
MKMVKIEPLPNWLLAAVAAAGVTAFAFDVVVEAPPPRAPATLPAPPAAISPPL